MQGAQPVLAHETRDAVLQVSPASRRSKKTRGAP